MTRFSTVFLACTLAFPLAALAQNVSVGAATSSAPGVRMKAGEIEVRAKVVELDMARRSATLRDLKGQLVTVDVPPEVKNFEQVRVGDELVVRYLSAVAARIEKAPRTGIRERSETLQAGSAAAGALPATAAGKTVEVLAVISALDRKAGTATLRGVRRTVTVNVPAGVDIAQLKVGDEVRAVFVEAAILSVERAPAKK